MKRSKKEKATRPSGPDPNVRNALRDEPGGSISEETAPAAAENIAFAAAKVTPEVAEILNELDAEQINPLLMLPAAPPKTARAGGTFIPEFMIGGLLAGDATAGARTRGGGVPFEDAMRGIYQAWRKTPEYRRLQKSSELQAALVLMNRRTLQRALGDLEASGVTKKVWNLAAQPHEIPRILSELSEEAARLGEFIKTEGRPDAEGPRKGMPDAGGTDEKSPDAGGTDAGQPDAGQPDAGGTDAGRPDAGRSGIFRDGLNSRDPSLDFARVSAITRAVNLLASLGNAAAREPAQIAENFKENPKRAIARALMYITAPSALLAWATYGDERIQETPRWQKDIFWLIPVGQGEDSVIWRIPKPFELGVVFGSIPERFITARLDMHYGGDADKAMRDFCDSLGGSLPDPAAPGAATAAMPPLTEDWDDNSDFADRPIIPAEREVMLPEYEYEPYTTEPAKAVFSMLGDLSLFGRGAAFAPAKLEHLFRDWSNGLGSRLLWMTDYALRRAGVLPDPEKPALALSDIPMVRAVAVRQPSLSLEGPEQLQRNWNEARLRLKTISGPQNEIRYEDVAAYLPYSVYEALHGSQEAIRRISGVINNILPNPDLSVDEKRQLVDSLVWQAVEIAKFGNEVFDSIKQDLERLAKEK